MKADTRTGDRHRSPRIAPLSMEPEDYAKLNELAARLDAPVAWVARRLITEGLACIDLERVTDTWLTEGFVT